MRKALDGEARSKFGGKSGRKFGTSVAMPAAIALLGCLSACGKVSSTGQTAGGSGGSPGGSPDAGGMTAPPPPFVAVAPSAYVAKVKNLLVGLPATDAEVQQIQTDPTQLKGLIDSWMTLPSYESKMRRFFELAFQQTQISAADFADQTYPRQIGLNNSTIPLLVQNAQQSFARTMIQLASTGRPMTDAVSTNQLMMTTALKELYAFLDGWEVDDDGKVTDYFKRDNPKLTLTVEAAQGPIAIADTLNPASPNYMHWYDPDVTTNDAAVAGCTEDPVVIPATGIALHFLLYGAIEGHKSTAGVTCPPSGGTAAAPQLAAATDFSDWSMVTIRPPAAGEAVTKFYDLPALRTATELVLSVPRVGFFSTPAFFANWQTNISNQMRVTMNQTLIVALGSSVDGTDATLTPGNPGLDAAHAGSANCLYCHQTLDPLRSIFAATYSWNYHSQLDTAFAAQKGMFSFRGVTQAVNSTGDMGTVLAQHPLFASAWVQKLCYYLNSTACDTTDPEFLRVVDVFKTSGYSWSALVKELAASPLITNASATQTSTATGEVIAVSRRDHFCAALDNRLGFVDVCGLDAVTKKQLAGMVPQIVTGMPSDGYGRGSTEPVLPNQSTLFYRAGTENVCEAIATAVIDVAVAKQTTGVKYWSSAEPDIAIADFVGTVMGLVSSDPRAAPATMLLNGHFAAAKQQGANVSDALKSTFVTACLAPSAVSIGL
ncbi:MAG TPA: hypothetical protein VGL59_05720 [Polyangia bacterium]